MKKILRLILYLTSLFLFISCDKNNVSKSSVNNEQFNNWYYTTMNDNLLYQTEDNIYLLDYNTMKKAELCNIPNCSHNSIKCLKYNLSSELGTQLPVIYNSSAYFFQTSSLQYEEDGLVKLKLQTKIIKYSFETLKFDVFLEFEGYLANSGFGSYLTDSKYYFICTDGDFSYDELGNIISSSNLGQSSLFCVDLQNGKYENMGTICDFDKLKKETPNINSIATYLIGKTDNKLYFSLNYLEEEIEDLDVMPEFTGKTYSFDIDKKEFSKVNDNMGLCVSGNYYAYFKSKKDHTVIIEDIKTGELYNGPKKESINGISIFDDKLWYDSNCFDIKTSKQVKFSNLEDAYTVSLYKDNYIIMGYDNSKVEIEKLPISDLEKQLYE